MQHIIFVNGNQSAIIVIDSPTVYTVTAFVDEEPTFIYDTTTEADAVRWAKAVIAYPAA